MLKMSSVALVALIVAASAGAAEQRIVGHGTNQPSVGNASSAEGDAPTSSGAIVVSGEARASANTVVHSGALSSPFIPVRPFTYAMSGNPALDAEVQKLSKEVNEREQRLFQNPDYRDLVRMRSRLGLAYSHQDLAVFMQIPKQQADRLLDLLAEQRLRDQIEGVNPFAGAVDPAAVQALIQKQQDKQRANEAEVAALLGASKFQDWKDYEQSGMARFMVQRLESALPDEARLQTEQRGSLLRAIAREHRKMYEERAVSIPPGQMPDENWVNQMRAQESERMAAAHERILEAATPILSPTQLEQLSSLLQQESDEQSQRQTFFRGWMPSAPPVMLPSRP